MTPFKFAHSDAGDWQAIARALVAGLAPGRTPGRAPSRTPGRTAGPAPGLTADPAPRPAAGGGAPGGGTAPFADSPATARLGFLYVTDVIAGELGSIVAYLRDNTGVAEWVGSVGLGICASGTGYFDRPAAAAMIGEFAADSFLVFPSITRDAAEMPAAARAWIERAAPPFGIVHGDPTNGRSQHLVEGLALATSGFLVGALTSSRGPQHQLAGRVVDGGVSGVFFAPAVEVATGLSQGCVPLGAAHAISECADNVIMTLDGEPALDVLKSDMGELLARDLARAAGYVHAAFPVAGSDTGDYLVRNLIGIDPGRGWLAVGAEIAAGDRVMFVRRDPKSAIEDLTRMVGNLKSRLPGPPKGGVYFSCVARGPNMFGGEGEEMALIRELLGDVPLVGFYGNGEISNNRLYGYTGVLALFL